MADVKLKGKWRIDTMAMWDKAYLDMLEPAYIEFATGGTGSLHFGCIYAEIDYKITKEPNGEKAEFTFYGNDEDQEVFGRGWSEVKAKKLHGHIYFHQGDHSTFVARKPLK